MKFSPYTISNDRDDVILTGATKLSQKSKMNDEKTNMVSVTAMLNGTERRKQRSSTEISIKV